MGEKSVKMNFYSRIVIAVNKELVKEHMEKLEAKKHLRIDLDQDCLRWTPLISNYVISEEERKAETEVGMRVCKTAT